MGNIVSTYMLDAALRYAALGWNIFPCKPSGKEPMIAGGSRSATTNENQIRDWWTRHPDANIGLLCGPASGVYVVDVDVDSAKGVNGLETLKKYPELEATITSASPRGGNHYLFKSTNPPSNKNSFDNGIDIRADGYYIILPPSIHPNGKAYEWEFGLDPWSIDLAEFPECFRPKKVTTPPWATPVKNRVATAASADVIERAKLYLAQCDEAMQGYGGHDKLLWAARAMVRGFKLSENDALALLWSDYNPRCVPPWNPNSPRDVKDFERKVQEAMRTPGTQPDGWLLEESYVSAEDDVLIAMGQRIVDALLANESRKQSKLVVPQAEEVNLLNPPGLVGELARWIESSAACSQPWLNLGAAITFCGALMGRKVQGITGTRTNIYTMLVGETSSGKDHARKMLRKLAHEAGCMDMIGAESITSDSAINAQLARSPSSIYLWDEIGHMFRSMKSANADPALAKVTPHLMTLFSSASESIKAKGYAGNPGELIDQPNLCFIGTGVPGRLQDALTVDQVTDGFLARILIFLSKDRPKPDAKRARNAIQPPPSELVEKVRNLWLVQPPLPDDVGDIAAETRAHPVVINEEPEAEEVFDAFVDHAYKMLLQRQEKNKNDLWGKAGELARKLALVVAVGDGRPNEWGDVIKAHHARWACSMVERLLGDLFELVSGVHETQFEKDRAYVLAVVERASSVGLRKRELTRQTRRLMPTIRDLIIKDLLESGDVIAIAEETEGRSAIRFVSSSNFGT